MEHPCQGKKCNECETCIYDVELFVEKPMESQTNTSNYCHFCKDLIKNYIGDDRSKFNACCNRVLINLSNGQRPRIIAANIYQTDIINKPTWCPKERGVNKEYYTTNELSNTIRRSLPSPSTVSTNVNTNSNITRPMTYSEKREKLMSLPKHLAWEEIEEGEIYVIPKILSQSRKLVKIIMKTDFIIRCVEIDENGEEKQYLTSIYPKDIDTVFITKALKY